MKSEQLSDVGGFHLSSARLSVAELICVVLRHIALIKK